MRDIESWVYRYFQYVVLYGTTDLRVNCPFCWARCGKEDIKHKLHVSLVKEAAHCFRCDYSASWIKLVMDVMDADYAHALGELYTAPRVKPSDELEELIELATRPSQNLTRYPNDLITFPKGYIPLTTNVSSVQGSIWFARTYLIGRGFGESYWRRYVLGVSDDIPWRVIIPVEGNFWQARAVFPFVKPKYISPNAHASHVLFNSIVLDIYDEIVVCEGAFSAMAVGENAIALLRKKATPDQLARLVESDIERFVIALDSDAKMESVELARNLTRGGKQVTIWQYRDGDPADGGEYISKGYGLKTEVEALLNTGGQGIVGRIECRTQPRRLR